MRPDGATGYNERLDAQAKLVVLWPPLAQGGALAAFAHNRVALARDRADAAQRRDEREQARASTAAVPFQYSTCGTQLVPFECREGSAYRTSRSAAR